MKLLRNPLVAVIACWAVTIAAVELQRPLLSSQVPLVAPPSTEALIALHKALVERPSVTRSEGPVSDYLKGYLETKGFTVYAQHLEEGRENILAYLGSSKKTRILVTSHIDTVPPFFPYSRRGGEVWGRGSVDAKASVASQIIAVEGLIATGEIQDGDVGLLFVVGEEGDARGMADVNDLGLSWEAVIFGEPTELKLARGHKGGLGVKVTAKGKTGHSGYPEEGKNAIDILVRALYALQEVQLPWSEDFGNTTVNIGRIEGGVAANVIPGSATAQVFLRVATGTLESIREIIENPIFSATDDVELEFTGGKGPVSIDYDIEGFETVVTNYGTDIPSLKGEHKKYLYGPGTILVAHSDHEFVKISDMETAVDGYKRLIRETLRRHT